MPIYEYLCPECEHKFEKLRPLSQADQTAECPKCRKEARRQLSTFACFSADPSGLISRVAGTSGGSSCGGCSSGSCSTCGS